VKQHLEIRAAEMRAKNIEVLRAELWADLDRKLKRGKLTPSEVAQARRDFWEARAADELLVREHRRHRNRLVTKLRRKSGKVRKSA
jgi:hypothetical protein